MLTSNDVVKKQQSLKPFVKWWWELINLKSSWICAHIETGTWFNCYLNYWYDPPRWHRKTINKIYWKFNNIINVTTDTNQFHDLQSKELQLHWFLYSF